MRFVLLSAGARSTHRVRTASLEGDHVMEADSLIETAVQAALLVATLVFTAKLIVDVVGWP